MCIARNLFLMALVCFLTSGGEATAFQGNTEVIKRHLEAIKARGEPTTRQEIDEKRNTLKPDVEDVSEIWRNGMQPMQSIKFYDREPPIPPYLKLLNKDKWPLPYEEWPDLTEVERHLKEFQPSINQFHEAARRGGYGTIDNTTVWHDDKSESEELFGTINATNLLSLDVVAQARKGQVTPCTRSLSAIMLLSRALHHRPGILGSISPSATDEESSKAIAHVLCVTPFTDADLAAYREIIRVRRGKYDLEQIYLEERIIDLDLLQNPVVGPYIRPSPALTESDWNTFFEISQQIIDNARKPFPEALIAEEKLIAGLEKQIEDATLPESRSRVLRFLRFRGYWNWFASFARHQVLESAAETGIAIELYRRENGKLPTTLDALVPKHLPSVPTDPFSGKPMLYKLNEKGFTIYSVGKNKTDEGGNLDPKTGDEGLFFPIK